MNVSKALTNNQLLLKECIIEEEFKENGMYDNCNAYFEHFAAAQVLKNYDLSDKEIADGVIGGSHDGGCDAIYVFHNDELVTPDQIDTIGGPKGSTLSLIIIQAKNETGFSEAAIMKWKTVSANLLNMSSDLRSYTDRYREQVLESFEMFQKAVAKLIRLQVKISIQYYYVTLADVVHPNVSQQAEELSEVVKQMYPAAKVSTTFVGADRLMELYNADTEVSVNLAFVENPIARGKNAEYIGLANLGTYYKFITDDNNRLRRSFFEANVRDYQGRNSVNSCIAESLARTGEEEFWWLNNGITILTERITPVTNKELVLVNPEIVNGLQTSTEVYNYFCDNLAAVESETRNVLIRVIVPTSEEARDNIIFATNNQTNIPKSSLRATDTIHLQIEVFMKSRGLYYDRRKNYYKNQKKKASDIVGVSFLAQCLISVFLRKPDFARARPSTLLTDEETYKKLYADNADLEVYYKTALLGKKVQANLNNNGGMTSAEKNDVLYYLLYAVAVKLVGKREIIFADMKELDIGRASEELINELRSVIYAKYKELGGNGRVAKSDTFITEIDSILGMQH